MPGTLVGSAGPERWEDAAVDENVRAWAASGAMALTGREDGPALGPPVGLVALVTHAAAVVSRHLGDAPALDGLALLGERAAIAGLRRHGPTSCGGGTRLLAAADGWMAVAFPRGDDVGSLPAWLERDVPLDDPWPVVARAVAARSCAELDERAALLGLPIAAVGSVEAPADTVFGLPLVASCLAEAAPVGGISLVGARVVDVSSLWAGPLAAHLLSESGADVVKVEAAARPDGARRSPGAFFDLLNGAKRSVVLDLETAAGRDDLARLVASADVVVESARPRALEQLGVVATEVLRAPGGPRLWVAITGHGRARADRVAFGDVAAAAGGLVTGDERGPCFVADAVADPLAGLVAAAATLSAWERGGRWLLDVGMAPIAAAVAGAPLDVSMVEAAPPRARRAPRKAPALGAHNRDVLEELASRR